MLCTLMGAWCASSLRLQKDTTQKHCKSSASTGQREAWCRPICLFSSRANLQTPPSSPYFWATRHFCGGVCFEAPCSRNFLPPPPSIHPPPLEGLHNIKRGKISHFGEAGKRRVASPLVVFGDPRFFRTGGFFKNSTGFLHDKNPHKKGLIYGKTQCQIERTVLGTQRAGYFQGCACIRISRTLKGTKTKEYLNQSLPGVLERLHTVGFWASAFDIYHGLLSKNDANWS